MLYTPNLQFHLYRVTDIFFIITLYQKQPRVFARSMVRIIPSGSYHDLDYNEQRIKLPRANLQSGQLLSRRLLPSRDNTSTY